MTTYPPVAGSAIITIPAGQFEVVRVRASADDDKPRWHGFAAAHDAHEQSALLAARGQQATIQFQGRDPYQVEISEAPHSMQTRDIAVDGDLPTPWPRIITSDPWPP